MPRRIVALALLIMLCLSLPLRAGTLALWTPLGDDNEDWKSSDTTPPATKHDDKLKVSPLSQETEGDIANSAAVWPTAGFAKLDVEHYTKFALTPNDGTTFDCTGVKYDFYAYEARTYTAVLRSSVDKFKTDLAVAKVTTTAAGRNTFELDLTKVAAMKSIAKKTEFRLYFVVTGDAPYYVDLAAGGPNNGLLVEGVVTAKQ